jgi:uroporphyrinogen-III synthase
VLRCPLVSIYDSPHSAQVLAFAVTLSDGGFDDFILITGEGLTRILSCIDKHDPALRPRFVEGLGRLRTITRGPKPARALRALGLKASIEATEPTTEGVIKSLASQPLEGRRVAVQLYGNDPNLRSCVSCATATRRSRPWRRTSYGNAGGRCHRARAARAHGRGRSGCHSRSPASWQIERLVTQHPAAARAPRTLADQDRRGGPYRCRGHPRRGVRVASSPSTPGS